MNGERGREDWEVELRGMFYQHTNISESSEEAARGSCLALEKVTTLPLSGERQR